MLNPAKLHLSRRQFNTLVGATALTAGFSRFGFADTAAPDASQIIHGKKADLIIHNAKLGVMETPLTELRKYAHTPKEILFNRYHFPHEGNAAWYATTDLPPADMVKNWNIRVDGLVQRPRDVSIADLQKMPQVKRVSVLQCAGNGRSYYAAKQKVAGGQWHHGGMGNVEWEGVELRPFLDGLKLAPAKSAVWLTAEGWDQPATPEGSDFAKSYRLDDTALDHAILASPGNETSISIRQHDIRLSAAPFPHGENVLAGEVVRQVFLGGNRDYIVGIADGTQLRVVAPAEQIVAAGTKVWLHLPPERCHVLAD